MRSAMSAADDGSRYRTIYRGSAPYLIIAAVVTVLLLFVVKLPLDRVDVPYLFAGDAVDKLAQIQNVAETGWLFHNDRLGYPFGYDRLDFPRFDSLNYAIMGPLAVLSGHVGAAMNLYFIASFYLIAFAAFYSLRRLGLDQGPALVGALVYAFLPYHVLRGVGHLTNGTYFFVPLAILVAVRLAQNRIGLDSPDARRRTLSAIAVAVLLPLQTPYNGVFFAFLCVTAGLIAFSQRMHWRTLLAAAAILAATGAAFVIEQMPVLMHRAAAEQEAMVAERVPWEAQAYSLQLNQVLLPTSESRSRAITEAKKGFDHAMFLDAPFYEVRNQYIGLFGVLGLGALLWSLARASGTRTAAGAQSDRELESTVRIAAMFAIAVLIVAMSSGLCTLIAYWITAKIRAYNRILPFLAFPCLLGAGWALQAAARRIASVWLRNAVIALVCVFVLFDVMVRPPFRTHGATSAEYDLGRRYFADVEKRLGEGAAVFQLPAVWYPEHPAVNRMGDYEEFKPFLFTRTLRFSYGVAHGRPGYLWGRSVQNLPPADMIAKAHELGFSAILIDNRGYATDDARRIVTDELTRSLPQAPSISEDRRWWLFPLDGCCDGPTVRLEPGQAPTLFTYVPGTALDFSDKGTGLLYNAGGWLDPESWGTWTRGQESLLRMRLDPVEKGPLVLNLTARVIVGAKAPQSTLRVEGNGRVIADVHYDVAEPLRTLRFELPPGVVGDDGLLELRFVVTPPMSPHRAGMNNDWRELGVGLTALEIDRVGANP